MLFMVVHQNIITPTLDGLYHTLVNESTPHMLVGYLGDSRKVTKKEINPIVNKAVTRFEKSQGNVARSVKVLYSKGRFSKRL